MTIISQKKVILVNDETPIRKSDSSLGIYLTADRVSQYIPMAGNMREKEEVKKETSKKTFIQKFHTQQKQCEYFQKCQDSMYSLLSSTTKE